MAKVWSGLKKRLVLDIGSSAVRICELTKTKTGYEVTKFVQREYNSDPSLDEQQRKELRVAALREALKESKVRSRKAILGVPGQSVFTRCRALPPVPEYKVSQIVRYEIQQQIPFGLDQIAMDYQILNKTEQGGFDVMMAAIKVDVVEKHIETLKPVKCSVAGVDVLPLAAYNWLKHQHEFGEQGDCVALVDIGAATTDIVIERGNQFRFTRPLNIGGNDVTKALVDAFNMDFVSAERIKRERGFAPTGDPNRDGKGGEVIGRVLQRLCTEIVRSFSYFRSLPGGGQVNRVLLTGGGACLKNIVPYMREQLGMDVRIVQPLVNVKINAAAQAIQQHPEKVCVVLGMALRCCETVTIDINLIPPRILERAKRKEQALYWAFSICALVMIFATIVPAAANENKLVKARIEELKNAIRAYDPELVQRIRPGMQVPESSLRGELESRKRHLQALFSQVENLDRARKHRRFWLDEIALVNEARPTLGQLWFVSLETKNISEEQSEQSPAGPGSGLAGRPGGLEQRSGAGFYGLQPPSGGAAGTGRGASGPPLARGGAAAGAKGGGSLGDLNLPIPNGFVIHGFAESDEVINKYIEELKNMVLPVENNMFLSVKKVIFSEASVQRAPWSILYDAPIDGVSAGRNATAVRPGESAIFSFSLEVQFARTVDRPTRASATSKPGGTA